MRDLRRATPADVPRLERIAHDAYAPYLPRMDGRRPAPMDADYVRHVAEDEVWVAEAGGEVAGFAVLVAGEGEMLLESVAVDPSRQGRGVGRLLLRLAEERAVVAGCGRVTLYTHEVMVENQRLYERIGYVETGRRGEDGYARVFYEKSLPGSKRHLGGV